MNVEIGRKKIWKRYRTQWRGCVRCELFRSRSRVVLGRGSLPCDILFVGEAPGHTEDAIGQPFVGRAGKVLDEWIAKTCKDQAGHSICTWAITNMVCCLPCEGNMKTLRNPTWQEIQACQERLLDFVALADPSGIVLLGNVAGLSFPATEDTPTKRLRHPAFVLRKGGVGSPASQEQIEELSEFIEGVLLNGKGRH